MLAVNTLRILILASILLICGCAKTTRTAGFPISANNANLLIGNYKINVNEADVSNGNLDDYGFFLSAPFTDSDENDLNSSITITSINDRSINLQVTVNSRAVLDKTYYGKFENGTFRINTLRNYSLLPPLVWIWKDMIVRFGLDNSDTLTIERENDGLFMILFVPIIGDGGHPYKGKFKRIP